MVNDLLILFKKAYKEKGDKIVLDYYKPKDGLYIRINKDGSRDYLIIQKETFEDELYKWFKERDYYSVLLEMNKPVDSKKKIHSNNYYTIFMKKDIFPGIGKNPLSDDEFRERVNNYFDVLEDTETKKDKYTEMVLKEIDSTLDHERIKKNKKYILENIDELIKEIKTYDFEGYISIFFEAMEEEYEIEYERYMIPRIFNKNSYNVMIDGEVWGLSNSNMGTNEKKPYLENKTMKCKVPYRVRVDDAIIIKKFFDWLNYKREWDMVLSYDYSFSGEDTNIKNIGDKYHNHILRFERTKDGQFITDYEYVPYFTRKIEFTLENVLHIAKKEKNITTIIEDISIVDIFHLEQKVNEIFFNKQMIDNYYGEVKSYLSSNLENLLIISRSAFNSFFRKGLDNGLKNIIEKIGKEIVKEHLRISKQMYINKAAEAFNLWVSLMKYLNIGGKEMADKLLYYINLLEDKGRGENPAICNSDEEFYFATGQIAYYLLSQSESSRLTHGVTEPFLRANTAVELKRQLKNVYEQYNHAISFKNKKFNQIFAMVMGYETKERLKKHEDMLLAGFMAKNIFYISGKEKENKEVL